MRGLTFPDVRVGLCALLCIAIALSVWWTLHGASGREITSDESLYLSEAVSIADGRFEYSSGEPIVHRPPLYPASLAAGFVIGGDATAARWIALAYAIGALGALYWLTRVLFGSAPAIAAVTIAGAASATRGLGASFFVDGTAAMWLMLSWCGVACARRDEGQGRAWWCAFSGAMLGLSFLTKETAMFWAPLPLVVLLVDSKRRLRASHMAAYAVPLVLLAAPWFGWVYWQTGEVYKFGGVGLPNVVFGIGAALALAGCLPLVARLNQRKRLRVATALVVAWVALGLFVLESRPEPQDASYVQNVPEWAWQVLLPSMQPWPLVLAAWAWFAWRAPRLGDPAVLLGPAVILGLPLLLFTANVGWEPRQVAWLAYLSYGVLAWAAVDVIGRLDAIRSEAGKAGAVITAVAAVALVAAIGGEWRAPEKEPSAVRDWNGADEAAISSWLDDLPDGSTILASRLYHSQLYVDQGGRLRIVQLPTLGITISADGQPQPFGTMFRYGDADTDFDHGRSWLWLGPYAGRPYYVGLAREDVQQAFSQYGPNYVLIIGDDAGFSSAVVERYMESQPGLQLIHERRDGGVQAFLFKARGISTLDASPGLLLTGNAFAHIAMDVGPATATAGFWHTLAPDGVVLDGETALDAEDLAALAADYAQR
jgi:4-amino-4-deoxy-L-arabinose transferase-like glycosyltransferase